MAPCVCFVLVTIPQADGSLHYHCLTNEVICGTCHTQLMHLFMKQTNPPVITDRFALLPCRRMARRSSCVSMQRRLP